MYGQLWLPDVQGGVDVDDSWLFLRRGGYRVGVLFELAEIGSVDRELDFRVLVSAAAECRDRPHTGTKVGGCKLRKNRRPYVVHHVELIAGARLNGLQADVDGSAVLR